jgi:regulator of protease activity HflC (stomatin/prohibitin superfamily)
MIKDIDLPDEVLEIIKNKVKTEQTSKQFAVDMEIKTKQLEFDLDKQRKEAAFNIEKQKTEQDASIEKQRKDLDFAIERQKKEAERLLIEAEAQKKAQTLQNETITDKTIQLKEIEAQKEWAHSENTKLIITDGKTPVYMKGGLMNMDIQNQKK